MAELTPGQEDNRQLLQSWLGQFNLSGLGTDVLSYLIDNRSVDYIKLKVLESPTFKQEFPEYQTAIDVGNPMSPAEILSYRETVKTLFTDFGLPSGFYDSKDDFVDLISKKLSPEELQTRVKGGYTRVASAPQEVKNVFNEYFGIQGDSLLATFFLDPARGAKAIDDAVTQAEIGGAGQQYGFGMTQAEAARYQQQGITVEQARQQLRQAAQLQPLAEETISEADDLTRSQLAEGALVGGDAETRTQRRAQERAAAFQGGGGAQQGRAGLGLGGAT